MGGGIRTLKICPFRALPPRQAGSPGQDAVLTRPGSATIHKSARADFAATGRHFDRVSMAPDGKHFHWLLQNPPPPRCGQGQSDAKIAWIKAGILHPPKGTALRSQDRGSAVCASSALIASKRPYRCDSTVGPHRRTLGPNRTCARKLLHRAEIFRIEPECSVRPVRSAPEGGRGHGPITCRRPPRRPLT